MSDGLDKQKMEKLLVQYVEKIKNDMLVLTKDHLRLIRPSITKHAGIHLLCINVRIGALTAEERVMLKHYGEGLLDLCKLIDEGASLPHAWSRSDAFHIIRSTVESQPFEGLWDSIEKLLYPEEEVIAKLLYIMTLYSRKHCWTELAHKECVAGVVTKYWYWLYEGASTHNVWSVIVNRIPVAMASWLNLRLVKYTDVGLLDGKLVPSVVQYGNVRNRATVETNMSDIAQAFLVECKDISVRHPPEVSVSNEHWLKFYDEGAKFLTAPI